MPAPTRTRLVVRDHATNAPFFTTCPDDLIISTTSSTVISGAEMAMITWDVLQLLCECRTKVDLWNQEKTMARSLCACGFEMLIAELRLKIETGVSAIVQCCGETAYVIARGVVASERIRDV